MCICLLLSLFLEAAQNDASVFQFSLSTPMLNPKGTSIEHEEKKLCPCLRAQFVCVCVVEGEGCVCLCVCVCVCVKVCACTWCVCVCMCVCVRVFMKFALVLWNSFQVIAIYILAIEPFFYVY